MKNDIKLFEQSKIRSVYDEEKDIWYFSVIDVIAILSESNEPKRYWSDLKRKLNKEANSDQPYEKIVRLKMLASDGKMRETDAADAETMLRIVQSVPSPKAEPIKQWLARVGYERMKETVDPAMSIDRARENWQKLGHSEKWIQQRMMGQETRNKLTDYWKDHEITKDEEYAILTNIIHQEWSGLSVKEHKQLKGLKLQNLRDHMSEAELIFTALAELSTRQVAENMGATGMAENKKAARRGGNVARVAKEKYEEETGKSVVTDENYLPKKDKKTEIEKK
ncbi:MAG: hypothetical protein IJ564_02850 [Alphaproteobacteria bacterium]|nr:hypothetical protein [Alphaproteobacteria bacterium]